jgi:hypothetical protein
MSPSECLWVRRRAKGQNFCLLLASYWFLNWHILDPEDGGEMFPRKLGSHGTTPFPPLHLVMNTDPISKKKKYVLKKRTQTMDVVQYNSHVYCTTRWSKTFGLNDKANVMMQTKR